MTKDEFLANCTACGGNWTAMLMTGIRAVAPEVYARMPDLGYTFDEAAFIAAHLCTDTDHRRFNCSIESLRVLEWGPKGEIRVHPLGDVRVSFDVFERIFNNNPVEFSELLRVAVRTEEQLKAQLPEA